GELAEAIRDRADRVRPGDALEPARSLGADPLHRMEDALGRIDAPIEAADLGADVAVRVFGPRRPVDLDDAALVDRDVERAAIGAVERTDRGADLHRVEYTRRGLLDVADFLAGSGYCHELDLIDLVGTLPFPDEQCLRVGDVGLSGQLRVVRLPVDQRLPVDRHRQAVLPDRDHDRVRLVVAELLLIPERSFVVIPPLA